MIRLLSAGLLPTVYGWKRSLLPYRSSSGRHTYSLNQNNLRHLVGMPYVRTAASRRCSKWRSRP